METLIAEGHSVHYLARSRSEALPSQAAYHHWGAALEFPPIDSVPVHDVIIHLAGEPIFQRWNDEVKKQIRTSRVLGTRNLVQAMERVRHRPRLLISGSAVGYYGNRGDEILTENSSPGQGFLVEVCQEWEQEAIRAEQLGLRVVRLRTGIVLGRNGGALQQMIKPFRMGVGGRLGSGKQWMPWIHQEDWTRMVIFASTNPDSTGAWNGTAPEPVRNSEFTDALAKALHRPALFPVPKFGMKLALGEVAESALDSIRAVPESATSAGFHFKFNRLEEALGSFLRN